MYVAFFITKLKYMVFLSIYRPIEIILPLLSNRKQYKSNTKDMRWNNQIQSIFYYFASKWTE